MTSLQITYFLKVADCMSFSGAAEELFVSQPSVSRQVQLLEAELGHRLFDRSSKRKLRLTPAGAVFRDFFQRSVRGMESAKITAGALETGQLRIRVGIGLGWDFTDQLLEFRKQALALYPTAELYFESDSFRNLQSAQRGAGRDPVYGEQRPAL